MREHDLLATQVAQYSQDAADEIDTGTGSGSGSGSGSTSGSGTTNGSPFTSGPPSLTEPVDKESVLNDFAGSQPVGLGWSWLPWKWGQSGDEDVDIINEETKYLLQFNRILGTKHTQFSQFTPEERERLSKLLGTEIDWTAFRQTQIDEESGINEVIFTAAEYAAYVAITADVVISIGQGTIIIKKFGPTGVKFFLKVAGKDGVEEISQATAKKLAAKGIDDVAEIAPKVTGKHSRKLADDLIAKGYPRPPGYQAGHIVPTNVFTRRSAAVQKAITTAQTKFDKYLSEDLRDAVINGFWAEAGHAGTHTDKFFLELGKAFRGVKSKKSAEAALESLWKRIEFGEFL